MFLVYLLIVFFISLFIYQIILAFYPKIEGMTTDETKEKEKNKSNPTGAMYEEYSKDPLILGQQNAGNIEYLKGRVDTISDSTTDIDKLQTTITAMQQQMDDMSTQMAQLSQNMISGTPPDMSTLNTTDTSAFATDNSNDAITSDFTDTNNDAITSADAITSNTDDNIF